MTNREHAAKSPSSAHRWFECPGSVPLSAGLPDDSSPEALEGVFAHEIAATCLLRGRRAEVMIGHTDFVHTVDVEMAAFVQVYLDAVNSIDGARRYTEQRVTLAPPLDDIFGTMDHAVLRRDLATLDVFDLKFGRGVYVPVQNNPQPRFYALGLLDSYPEAFERVERIVLHITQPRHHLSGGDEFEEVTREELEQWRNDVAIPASKRVDQPDPPLKAGEWCRFCRARPRCPALRGATLERVQQLFDDETMTKRAAAPPDPRTLTAEEVSVALRAFPVIEEWMRMVNEHAYTLAMRGESIDGFKLVQKEGNRKWRDPVAAAIVLEAYLRADQSPWEPPKMVTPAAAERLLPKALHSVVDALVERPGRGTVLVPVSDKRPAISRADVFDDVLQLPNDTK